jgi:hypothetical protein
VQVILARAIVEQVAAQEVEFSGDDGLVLVEEGGVVRAADLEDLACGGPVGGLQRRCREDSLVVGVTTASTGQLMRLAVLPGRYRARGMTERAAMVCCQSG